MSNVLVLPHMSLKGFPTFLLYAYVYSYFISPAEYKIQEALFQFAAINAMAASFTCSNCNLKLLDGQKFHLAVFSDWDLPAIKAQNIVDI